MNNFLKAIGLVYLLSMTCISYAERPGAPVVSLFNGQWVEILDKDPAISQRDVRHIWLHRGTRLFNVSRPSNNSPYRDAITYTGLPVRVLAKKRSGGWHIENVDDPNTHKPKPAFHLTRNVFCPYESNPIVLNGSCLHREEPLGEGYIFDLLTIDEDQDGVPDKKSNRDYFRVVYELDEKTKKELGEDDDFEFNLFAADLDSYETAGVLFRIDRQHPQRQVKFLDSDYQECGSTETSTIEKSLVLEAYAEAEGKAEFGFWNWFKAAIGVGTKTGVTASDENTVKVTSTASEATRFRQWGIIFDYSKGSDHMEYQTPFYIEKLVECEVGEGPPSFGERIKNIEIEVWDHFLHRNSAFEFNRSEDLQSVGERQLDKVDKPVFISVNSSRKQNDIIEKIKADYKVDHYLAMFMFSQINLACPESVRKECISP